MLTNPSVFNGLVLALRCVQAYETHNACMSCVYIRVGRGHRAGMRIYACIIHRSVFLTVNHSGNCQCIHAQALCNVPNYCATLRYFCDCAISALDSFTEICYNHAITNVH